MYALEFTLEARDDLSGLDRPIAQRILSKLHGLAENVEAIAPEPRSGEWHGLFKQRIGSHPALYTINRPEQRLTVHVVGHRREVYRRS
jgi:mRNA interferase RelE/StbE